MEIGRRGDVAKRFRALFEAGSASGLSDPELLDRSLSGGVAAEVAFAALVERHGPMVLRVCRRALGDVPDAHDAFQSTFLILARRAASIRDRGSAASWLHGVALRVSRTALANEARRRRHERASALGKSSVATAEMPDDLGSALHQEVGRLPGRFREPVVLCYLEGRSCEEAAEALAVPVGTVKSRLATARGRLRDRLTRRGLAPSAAGAVATLLAAEGASASAAPLPGLSVETTTEAALRFSKVPAMAGSGMVPDRALALAKGVLRAMMMNKLKVAAVALSGVLVLGSGLLAQQAPPAGTTTTQDDSVRLQEMERKLDRLLRAVEGPKVGVTATTVRTTEQSATPPVAIPAPPMVPAVPEGSITVKNTSAPFPWQHTQASVDRITAIEQKLQRLEERIGRLEAKVSGEGRTSAEVKTVVDPLK